MRSEFHLYDHFSREYLLLYFPASHVTVESLLMCKYHSASHRTRKMNEFLSTRITVLLLWYFGIAASYGCQLRYKARKLNSGDRQSFLVCLTNQSCPTVNSSR